MFLLVGLGNPGSKECQINIHDEKRKETCHYLGDTPTRSNDRTWHLRRRE